MDRKRTVQDKTRPGWWTLAVLVSGALAWTLVVVVILVALRGRDGDSLPEGDPIAAQNTPQDALPPLGVVTAAASSTASPTVTEIAASLTTTATEAASLTASAAPTEPPTSTSTRAVPTLPPVPLITLAISAVPPSPGPSPTPTLPPAPTLPPSPTPTPEPTVCPPPPDGWERYTVQAGDTLFAFVLGAKQPGLTVDDLLAANCLSSRFLAVGQVLYLPAGAAENAPPSEPYVPPAAAGAPRPGSCPCTLSVAAGWRREQIADMITRSGTTFSGADFLAVTGPGVNTPFDFVNARPAGVSMEGYLFPGTYTVGNETTAEQFRDMLLAAFAGAVSDQMRADAAAQGVTFHQALTIASIVQRETAGAELERLVASVYYNRLRDGTPLGATVTVQYALGAPGAWWPRVRSLDVQSPYNTYRVSGLPPGPICSPGLSAITAAVYPPATNYRFHTASCTGAGEVFAETYEEHLRNVNCGG